MTTATPHSPRPGLTLLAAILINLNVMVGAGIFVNTVTLAQRAGPWGALTYALVGILMLPLILCFSKLMRTYHGGSFYQYGAALHPWAGFISIWSYAITKLASCGVALTVSCGMLKTVFSEGMKDIPVWWAACIMMAIFIVANNVPIKISSRTQARFFAAKLIAVFALFAMSYWAFSIQPFVTHAIDWPGITASIPFVLYAFMGFEASCMITHALADPQRDGARAIGIAYLVGVCINVLFQLCFAGSVPHLSQLGSYLDSYPALIAVVGVTGVAAAILIAVLHLSIATSAGGVGFGIIATNAWNFIIMAEHNLIPGASWLAQRNSHGAPWRCLLLEGAIIASALALPVPILQQIAAAGVTLSYLISVCALTRIADNARDWLLILAGITSCCILLGASFRTALMNGSAPLIALGAILIIGLVVHACAGKPNTHNAA